MTVPDSNMQPAEAAGTAPDTKTSGPLPQHSSKLSVNGAPGFSHGAFNSNKPTTEAGGFRDRQGGTIPAINTNHAGHGTGMQSAMDGQTPGTAYDMNFTPLLPSQLLMGSPFQPGSSSTFASPHFQNFPNFTPMGAAGHSLAQGGQIGSPVQNHQSLSPQFQSMLSPGGMGGTQYYGGSHLQNGAYGGFSQGYSQPMQMAPGLTSGTSRTVYLGNIPPDTSAEELLGHVRSGQIESVRLLPDKNCAFISFLDGSSAVHFHSDAILKKLSIRGQDIKVGWGKPSQVPTSVALAIQQSGASRNVYLGNLPAEITEDEIREDLGKYGAIDTIKLVREKSIGFVHFLSIGSAIKAVSQLPSEPNWQAPRRVFYGKDRCAYVSKTQQQNAAQYLGIAPGFAHVLNSTDRDVISNHLAQQSVAAAAVATAAGGVNNLGNRTVYLGNIHPETTTEEICNVVRGGLLHHVRYIPDKHICFVTFIDPTSAASFYAMSNMQGLMIHNRRLKIGWGKHSQALPPAIALAVSGGASRNVYIGNIDETWSEERLRQDFAEYGEIELVNTLREKSCAFVNFTNIANAIKAIEGVRGKEEYKRFKINFGKDRCGNPPRQIHHAHSEQAHQPTNQSVQDGPGSPQANENPQATPSEQANPSVSPAESGISRPSGIESVQNGVVQPGSNHFSQHGFSSHMQSQPQQGQTYQPFDQQLSPAYIHGQDQQKTLQSSYFTGTTQGGNYLSRNRGLDLSRSSQQLMPSHGSSSSFSVNNNSLNLNANNMNGVATATATTIGGMLAPSNNSRTVQHSRAISLPAFSQYYNMVPQQAVGVGAGIGYGSNAYGLAIHGEGPLPRWAEEEVGS